MPCTMRPRVTARLVAALACMGILTTGCAPGEMEGPAEEDAAMERGMDGDGMQGMEGMAMGEMADISVAAEGHLSTMPPEPLAWMGYRFEEADGAVGTHGWGPAFLFAADDARALVIDGAEATLEPGKAVFVEEGVEHTRPEGSFWAFVLTDPEAEPAPGLEDGTRVLSSGPLEALPDGPADLRFLIVELPPEGGQTTVHTHPGPEFIHVVQGEIEYETGVQETTVLNAGDGSALPADTAVQKRNVSKEAARFWSWFIVDPDEPFSSETTFQRG